MSFPVWLIISLAGKNCHKTCLLDFFFFIYISFRVFTLEVGLVKSLKDFRFQLLRRPFVIFALEGGYSFLYFSRMKSLLQRREKHLNEIIYTARNNQHIRGAGVATAEEHPFLLLSLLLLLLFYIFFFHALLFSKAAWTRCRRNRSPRKLFMQTQQQRTRRKCAKMRKRI